MKIKYIGEHLTAKDYRIPEYDWKLGEIKDLPKNIADRFLENPDFVKIEKEQKTTQSSKEEEIKGGE